LLLQKNKLKNIVVAAKFLLGIITLSAALLIHNCCSLNSIYLYLLILATAVIQAVLNRAYKNYYEKIKSKNKINETKEIFFNFNLERILIVILAASTAFLIEINIIPVILIVTAVYYFLSAYVNTFQEI
jgi:Na+-transporting methylmalonyl-CoA/oxaloacetate decarboxylase gamma subunit